jgi:AraC family transcriptional regulator
MREPSMPPAVLSANATSFARDMTAAFGGPHSAAELRELRFGPFTVMDVRCDVPNYGVSAPIPFQDALLVALQMRACLTYDMWEDGKRLDCLPVRRGMVNVSDLRRNVVSASKVPFHALTFTLPVRTFDDSDGAGRALELGRTKTGLDDPVIQGLGMALLPAIEHPESAPRMFVEHVLWALRAHLVHRFGGPRAPRRGGLSSRQLRCTQEFLDAHLGENISLGELAATCSLSAAHFARAFRLATGMPPHRYLMVRRVSRARELLVQTGLPLSDIAVLCGFADQSHMTKAFRRVLGATPGSLRPGGR